MKLELFVKDIDNEIKITKEIKDVNIIEFINNFEIFCDNYIEGKEENKNLLSDAFWDDAFED